MKILVTADLHYNIARSREPVERLAEKACRRRADALVLLGDVAGEDLGPFADCLALFAGFPGRKFLVPGNHCLWTTPEGADSLTRYHHQLPAVAGEHDFTVLDHNPTVLGEVGLVGCIGWYDYSLRDESLGIPLPFYHAKASPGAAEYYGMDELVADHRDVLTERHMRMGVRWRDGQKVRLTMSDEEFTEQLDARLSEQLAELSPRCERIVAMFHHLPFAELVPRHRPDRFAFAAAYLGAKRLGQTLLDCPKVTHVYCGHSHWPIRRRIGSVEAVNVGSTYKEKRLEVLTC
jgi:predicted phosphodiesterase